MHNHQPHNSSVVDYKNHHQGKPLPTILTQRTSIAYCFHDRATCHSAESCQHWSVAFTNAKIRRKSTRPSHARKSAVLAIQDHPSNPHLICTSSYDGTIRELNLESQQSMEVFDGQALSAKDNIFLLAFKFSNQDRKIWASNTTGSLVHCNRVSQRLPPVAGRPLASDQQPKAPPDKLSNALPTLMYPSLL
ncbi:hypothetical protein PtA15_13A303 [Puccinia triticina]|uniref:Anaphase-promoting complex subunit 4 WD40 domain-containing protein n=1 Tax=Puccinia triticina TaxID=208348 RepID=A0ABY7D184_9BASI|nr:uncharacterized protein PtA15_13A303 [Puccinia triticina]WAQ90903.1 hypothetical protein PtA15_13A303 [Puccinia triticina]